MTENLAAWLLEQLDEDERLRPYYGDRCGNIHDDRCLMRPGCPDRVALEIQSKRALVELHKSGGATSLGDDSDPASWRDYCATCGSGEPHEYPTWWPCDTLRLLALPYGGRPGYREEWRP